MVTQGCAHFVAFREDSCIVLDMARGNSNAAAKFFVTRFQMRRMRTLEIIRNDYNLALVHYTTKDHIHEKFDHGTHPGPERQDHRG